MEKPPAARQAAIPAHDHSNAHPGYRDHPERSVQQNVDTYRPTQSETAALCPGRCNAAFRAAERRYETTGTDHDIQPWDGQPVWCPPCTTAIRAAVADWPDLAARLVEEIESGVSAGLGEYVSGSKDTPVHDHQAASFLLDEFAEWIGAWEATIRVERRLARRKATTDPRAAIGNACEFLLPHLDWQLRERDDAGDLPPGQVATDFGTQLLGYHRRAQHLTGTQDAEPVRIEGVPCKNCDHNTLEYEVESGTARQTKVERFRYDDNGEVRNHLRPHPVKITEAVTASMQGAVLGYVRCRRCKPVFRMTLDEYHDWTKLQAAGDEARSRATKDKLAEIFGNSVPTQYRTKP